MITRLTDAQALMNEITGQSGLQEWLGERVDVETSPAENVVNYCHPAGGCRLGAANDSAAVVGPTGAVHGLDGLSIADASVMPTITRGTLTSRWRRSARGSPQNCSD